METTYDELPNEYVLSMKKQLDIDNLNALTGILQEHKCVIAGSYVLQTVCGENWANDIDIWCSASPSIVSDIEELGYRLVKSIDYRTNIDLIKQGKIDFIDRMLNEEKLSKSDMSVLEKTKKYWENYEEKEEDIPEVIETYRRLKEHVSFIYFLVHDTKPPIQVIDVKNIMDCIATFDFNICQVYYDGENVVAKNAFKKAGFLACIKYRIGKITYEASKIQSSSEWYRTLRRALKYTQRGFFIDFTQAYPFLQKGITTDQWNSIVCGNCSQQLKNVQPNDFKNFNIVKTLKLPYFHTHIEGRGEIIFGYNVNPNNNMNSIIKGLMKHEVFRKNSRSIKGRCLNRTKVNINEPQELKKILHQDIVDAVSSIYESNYNPTIREWSLQLYDYYLNVINYVLNGTDVEAITQIEQFIEEMLEEKEDIEKLDIENPQKIFTDFRRYIVDYGRADKDIKIKYLERIKNIAIELNKKGKINGFTSIIKLCTKLIDILRKKGVIKKQEEKCETINFLPLFDIIFKGSFRDNNFVNELFNSIVQQLCSDVPLVAREKNVNNKKFNAIKNIINNYLEKSGLSKNIKVPLIHCLSVVSTYIGDPITEFDINKQINKVALWGSHKFNLILTDEQRRRLTIPDIDEDEDEDNITHDFYHTFNGYLFGITIDKFRELYNQIPNINDEIRYDERTYKILEYISKYLGIYNEELRIEILYFISELNEVLTFDEFKKIYERVEHTDDLFSQLGHIENEVEEN